jgi:hypothetical protein
MRKRTSHVPSVQSSAQAHFAQAPQANINRSRFDRSHGHKTTFDAGQLIPILVDEVLPGDTFTLRATAFARVATLLFPIMDNIQMDFHFFFVPYRLVWEHWEQFNGAQANPTDSVDYLVPTITAPTGGFVEGSIYDYMGIPVGIDNITVNALIPRAYNLIYNEWYRDENIQNSVPQTIDDGPDISTDYVVLPRGKRKDYFTSALPFPQKGPAVTIDLGTNAPIVLDTSLSGDFPAFVRQSVFDGSNLPPLINTGTTNETLFALPTTFAIPSAFGSYAPNTPASALYDPNGTLVAQLSGTSVVTVNALRQAFQVQKLYERDARGGTRYTEILHSHFGVISPDARLQRPEYLGGGSSPVLVSPVPQTVPQGGSLFSTPQANLAAFGTSSAHGIGFTRSFVEHGCIIGLVSVRADLNYQQGLNRMWSRQTRLDFYWPVFQALGEQAILNKEIYSQGTVDDDDVFGYQECFAEYRYKPSQVTGLFRSNATGTLDSWHLAQNFASLPTLSPTFIVENPPMARIEAVVDEPDFIFDSFFQYHCVRPMPVFGVPGLIDHF